MPATGCADRQGLAAYYQERGNLATLSSLQRPPRATLSPLASRPLIGAGKLCHAPPTAATATGGADLQGPAAYHQERGNISGYTVLFGLRPFILLQGKSFNGRLDRAVARSTHHGLRRLFSTGLRASMGPGPEPRSYHIIGLAVAPGAWQPCHAPLHSSARRGPRCFSGLAASHRSGAALSRSSGSNARRGLRCASRPSGLSSGARQPCRAPLHISARKGLGCFRRPHGLS
jgi:hypothetical protein